MFREAWRFERDYFYVDNVHGLDMDWAYKTYSAWIDDCKHRGILIIYLIFSVVKHLSVTLLYGVEITRRLKRYLLACLVLISV